MADQPDRQSGFCQSVCVCVLGGAPKCTCLCQSLVWLCSFLSFSTLHVLSVSPLVPLLSFPLLSCPDLSFPSSLLPPILSLYFPPFLSGHRFSLIWSPCNRRVIGTLPWLAGNSGELCTGAICNIFSKLNFSLSFSPFLSVSLSPLLPHSQHLNSSNPVFLLARLTSLSWLFFLLFFYFVLSSASAYFFSFSSPTPPSPLALAFILFFSSYSPHPPFSLCLSLSSFYWCTLGRPLELPFSL